MVAVLIQLRRMNWSIKGRAKLSLLQSGVSAQGSILPTGRLRSP